MRIDETLRRNIHLWTFVELAMVQRMRLWELNF